MLRGVSQVALFVLLLATTYLCVISSCSSSDYIKKVQASIASTIDFLQQNGDTLRAEINSITPILSGLLPSVPASSCLQISLYPSGNYWVMASNGSAVRVYCDMSLSCGGITGGWMRVAELDMTNSSHQCPSGLIERIYPSGKRTCVRTETTAGCSSTNSIIPSGVEYSNVCGRVIGYQYGSTDAFFNNPVNINSIYVDGVSITHGDQRQHIWTFAAGFHQLGNDIASCPCSTNGSHVTPPPAFVGEDYFCDSGNIDNRFQQLLYGDDPLWDEAGCITGDGCCTFNNPPWFYKQLPQPTTDNIEMRVCRNGGNSSEDVAIEVIEVFVQ